LLPERRRNEGVREVTISLIDPFAACILISKKGLSTSKNIGNSRHGQGKGGLIPQKRLRKKREQVLTASNLKKTYILICKLETKGQSRFPCKRGDEGCSGEDAVTKGHLGRKKVQEK